MSKLTIVDVCQNGSDRALFKDGKLILSADPSCGDDVDVVIEVGENLALIDSLPLSRYDYFPSSGWCWDDIMGGLKGVI
jgi:hypothetical protein